MERRLRVKVTALSGESVLLVNFITNILQYLAQILTTRHCCCCAIIWPLSWSMLIKHTLVCNIQLFPLKWCCIVKRIMFSSKQILLKNLTFFRSMVGSQRIQHVIDDLLDGIGDRRQGWQFQRRSLHQLDCIGPLNSKVLKLVIRRLKIIIVHVYWGEIFEYICKTNLLNQQLEILLQHRRSQPHPTVAYVDHVFPANQKFKLND